MTRYTASDEDYDQAIERAGREVESLAYHGEGRFLDEVAAGVADEFGVVLCQSEWAWFDACWQRGQARRDARGWRDDWIVASRGDRIGWWTGSRFVPASPGRAYQLRASRFAAVRSMLAGVVVDAGWTIGGGS